ncbi:hypothetical protein FMEAI12_2900019 [Parafrankia sp. Ea1.12]|nr:hypothetical protein FMEAI12_2900019 [Parafrankia sp. Ea1.12]
MFTVICGASRNRTKIQSSHIGYVMCSIIPLHPEDPYSGIDQNLTRSVVNLQLLDKKLWILRQFDKVTRITTNEAMDALIRITDGKNAGTRRA